MFGENWQGLSLRARIVTTDGITRVFNMKLYFNTYFNGQLSSIHLHSVASNRCQNPDLEKYLFKGLGCERFVRMATYPLAALMILTGICVHVWRNYVSFLHQISRVPLCECHESPKLRKASQNARSVLSWTVLCLIKNLAENFGCKWHARILQRVILTESEIYQVGLRKRSIFCSGCQLFLFRLWTTDIYQKMGKPPVLIKTFK